METYCGSCKKYTENENSNVTKTVCGQKKSTFITNKELHNFH